MRSKVSVVTGGVTGIGRAVVDAMAGQGFTVVLCDADAVRGPLVEGQLLSQGAKVIFKHCNVTEETQINDVVDEIKQKYGRIDCLVNNAGIIRRRSGPEIKVLDWDEVFAVNARGAFLFCKYVAEIMMAQGSGRIVNVSSIAAKLGDITSAPGYGPSKAALDCLTKTFARELAPYGITVNGVAPHAIATEMSAQWTEERRQKIIEAIPLKRLGKPEEVAAVVMFLLSEGASFITGEIIDVNGGFLMD